MTKQDQKKLGVLVFLLGVLSLTIVLGYRMNQPTTTAAVPPPQVKAAANSPAPSDARIRLDLVEKPEASQDIGKRNLFQYQPIAPPSPPVMPSRGGVSSPPPPQYQPVTAPAPRLVPTPGPQFQPIPFKYQGFAALRGNNSGLVAFLADDTRNFNVQVGEVLMGRYRIASITDKSVEVEDLQNSRRQTLPLIK